MDKFLIMFLPPFFLLLSFFSFLDLLTCLNIHFLIEKARCPDGPLILILPIICAFLTYTILFLLFSNLQSLKGILWGMLAIPLFFILFIIILLLKPLIPASYENVFILGSIYMIPSSVNTSIVFLWGLVALIVANLLGAVIAGLISPILRLFKRDDNFKV